jgi:hypothetical protein
VLTGQDALFDVKPKYNIGNIPDGTANTLLIVEAGRPVPWTKPADLPYRTDMPLPKLGGSFRMGFYAVMADDLVRFVSKEVSEKTLRCAINPHDGQVLGPDW